MVRYADSVATVLLASDLASLRRELDTMLAEPDILIEEASVRARSHRAREAR